MSIEFNLKPVDSKSGSERKRASRRRGRSSEKPVQKSLNSNNHREELGRWLWGAADILRGAVRAEDYQEFMLPLLFFKRLSDEYLATYEEKLARARNMKEKLSDYSSKSKEAVDGFMGKSKDGLQNMQSKMKTGGEGFMDRLRKAEADVRTKLEDLKAERSKPKEDPEEE